MHLPKEVPLAVTARHRSQWEIDIILRVERSVRLNAPFRDGIQDFARAEVQAIPLFSLTQISGSEIPITMVVLSGRHRFPTGNNQQRITL